MTSAPAVCGGRAPMNTSVELPLQSSEQENPMLACVPDVSRPASAVVPPVPDAPAVPLLPAVPALPAAPVFPAEPPVPAAPAEPPAPAAPAMPLVPALPLPAAPPTAVPPAPPPPRLTQRFERQVSPSSQVPFPKQAHFSLPAGQPASGLPAPLDEHPAMRKMAGASTQAKTKREGIFSSEVTPSPNSSAHCTAWVLHRRGAGGDPSGDIRRSYSPERGPRIRLR